MNASLEKEKIEIIKWVAGLKDGVALERLMQFKANPGIFDKIVRQVDEERIRSSKLEDELFGEILKKSKRSGRLNEKKTKAMVASIR